MFQQLSYVADGPFWKENAQIYNGGGEDLPMNSKINIITTYIEISKINLRKAPN